MISLGKENDRYMMVGMLSAFIPINIIGSAMSKDPSVKNFDDYYKLVRYAPLFMGILNIIVFNLIGRKYLLAGFIIAIILSSIGRYIFEIPQKVLKMSDPLNFQIFAAILWPLYYMYVARFVIEDIKL
jgi:hypothetical protein